MSVPSSMFNNNESLNAYGDQQQSDDFTMTAPTLTWSYFDGENDQMLNNNRPEMNDSLLFSPRQTIQETKEKMTEDDLCNYMMEYLNIKLVLVVMVGSSVSIVSVIQNSVVLLVLIRRKSFRSSNLLYFIFLAVCDILTALSYLSIMSVQIMMENLQSKSMSIVWHSYFRELFTVSNISKSVSTFLLINATIERYLVIVKKSLADKRLNYRFRFKMVLFAISLGCFFNFTTYFELGYTTLENCTNHNYYFAGQEGLASNNWYRDIWMFYVRNIVSVFLPFAILLYLNATILSRAREQHKKSLSKLTLTSLDYYKADVHIENNRRQVRQSTRMLIAVAATYLAANALNVFVTAWEHVNPTGLHQHRQFYTLAADTITLMTVVCGMIRLQIYCWCNPVFRSDVLRLPHVISADVQHWRRCCSKDSRRIDGEPQSSELVEETNTSSPAAAATGRGRISREFLINFNSQLMSLRRDENGNLNNTADHRRFSRSSFGLRCYTSTATTTTNNGFIVGNDETECNGNNNDNNNKTVTIRTTTREDSLKRPPSAALSTVQPTLRFIDITGSTDL